MSVADAEKIVKKHIASGCVFTEIGYLTNHGNIAALFNPQGVSAERLAYAPQVDWNSAPHWVLFAGNNHDALPIHSAEDLDREVICHLMDESALDAGAYDHIAYRLKHSDNRLELADKLLCSAAGSNDIEGLRVILNHADPGVDILAALRRAALCNSIDVVQELLPHSNFNTSEAFNVASIHGHGEVARVIQAYHEKEMIKTGLRDIQPQHERHERSRRM